MTHQTDPSMSKDAQVDLEMIEHCDTQARAGYIGNQEDHQQTIRQVFRENKVTVAWCIYVWWLLLVTAFDNQAGGFVLSIPQFRKDFGYAFEGNYVLPAEWQSAYSGGPVAG